VSTHPACKFIKLISSPQYDNQISNHFNWLQSVIGIPNLTSDVLLVLDCYMEAFTGGGVEETITYLYGNDCPWARYGIIAAGYAQNSVGPGGFSGCFMSTLEDLAHSGQLVNCTFVIRKLREAQRACEDDMELLLRGNDGRGSIILAPRIE
jgi:hypothetical protein